MRGITTREKIAEFMREFGRHATENTRVYFTGGATSVLMGWRDSTIDIDIRFIPELDALFRAIPALKERLEINIELASPPDFIPPVPGWEERSRHIKREGKIDFYHYDAYSQALAKIERGHAQDIEDINSMLREGLIIRDQLSFLFQAIEPQLYRYPAIDPPSFAAAVRKFVESE